METTMIIRANNTDYDGHIVVEWHAHPDYDWSVPAWEEMGHSDLAGPFDTMEDALDAVSRFVYGR